MRVVPLLRFLGERRGGAAVCGGGVRKERLPDLGTTGHHHARRRTRMQAIGAPVQCQCCRRLTSLSQLTVGCG